MGGCPTLATFSALRLTPWRMLLVEGDSTLALLPGLILDPADPRLRVGACTGAPGCTQALWGMVPEGWGGGERGK